MVRVATGLCAVVLLLAGCGSSTGEPGRQTSTPPGSVLAKITAQQACDLLDDATITRSLGVEPGDRDGRQVGKAPVTMTYLCNYHTGVPGLSTEVSTTETDKTDEQVLDGAFTDRASGAGAPGEYDPVPGLGTLAGFGPDATMASGGVNSHRLAVVFRVGDERLLLVVSVLGKAKLDQLQPLAEELSKKLATAVG